MCGITGLYSTRSGTDKSALRSRVTEMAAAMRHRGPDAGGAWADPEAALALGHRRLSIIDLSEAGAQPMESESGRYVISYNGEFYNFLDIQKELKAAGFNFRGRSDTEVFLTAVEFWGLNLALQKMNGMFAVALWDRKEKKLHLIRDRMGKKPLYVGWAGDDLVFASELKALRAHPDFKPDISRAALSDFVHYAFINAPLCIYEKAWTIPAGFRLMIDTRTIKPDADLSAMMEPYWHHGRVLEEQVQRIRPQSDATMIAEFESLLMTCVSERMISDVPLGAFLSGGIDSSAVVALMQKISSRPVKTYTIGFPEQGYDEAVYAAKIASHLGTEHHEHYMGPQDALDVIPLLPDMYDEPFADISAIPTYLVAKFARQDVTVALSGDGGDEMLGGYNRHFIGPKLWNTMSTVPLSVRRALAGAAAAIPAETLDKLFFFHPQAGTRIHKLATILPIGTPAEVFQRLICQWHNPLDIVKNGTHSTTTLLHPDWQASDDIGTAEKMMYWDTISYLPNDILVKVDRASMAVSLEARAPLLDKRVYEYAWSLPHEAKIRNAKGKWLLREVLKRHVPAALFERPKQGFAMPAGTWLRGPLREWAEELLSVENLEEGGFLNATPIRQAWTDHLRGTGNHGSRLWTILMFQAWKERWL